jgi:hypothetical protein
VGILAGANGARGMPPGDRADGEEIPWGTDEEVGVGCNGGRDMGIGSLGWGSVEATGDGGGGGVSGFAGMTIEGSGARGVVVFVVGGVTGELGGEPGAVLGDELGAVLDGGPGIRVSGRGAEFSGPAAIT